MADGYLVMSPELLRVWLRFPEGAEIVDIKLEQDVVVTVRHPDIPDQYYLRPMYSQGSDGPELLACQVCPTEGLAPPEGWKTIWDKVS